MSTPTPTGDGHSSRHPFLASDHEMLTRLSQLAAQIRGELATAPQAPGLGEPRGLHGLRREPLANAHLGEASYYFVDEPGPAGDTGFMVDTVRSDFPMLAERVNGRPLVWLDNAATTQKPQPVIDRLRQFYCH